MARYSARPETSEDLDEVRISVNRAVPFGEVVLPKMGKQRAKILRHEISSFAGPDPLVSG